ncbi:zinc finger and SCAN domain-containing protein 22-like [Uranotaenia lowii]|uniref:zinc finger and SCAN domain-containing protein 22-like n=1 Tax=Uranotaenia lowii TaxID=190385 RepID=UPI002479ECFD|nr:zinc finger and SCAN domain-containing protein 22-like [Uranotaenia lowii]
MANLLDIDSPFIKKEKACKICGASEGDMESMFCRPDDSKLLNKIYKCTRVEVTPVCGLISPICESCRKRIDAFDENAKPKVVEFVIKDEPAQGGLDYDPLGCQDPMAMDPMAMDPMAMDPAPLDDSDKRRKSISEDDDFDDRHDYNDDDHSDHFQDLSIKLEIDLQDAPVEKSETGEAALAKKGEPVKVKGRRGRKPGWRKNKDESSKAKQELTKDNEKENVPRPRLPRKTTEKVKSKSGDNSSDSEWGEGNDYRDDGDNDDVKYDSGDSSDDDKPLKKRKEKKKSEAPDGISGKKKIGRPRKERLEGEPTKVPTECEICGRFVSYMREHMRTHRADKQHKCPYCDRLFVQANNLKYHIRKHLGEKPFVCEVCNKSFYCASHLKSHMRVHGPQGLYQCDKCPKTFNQECNLRKHLRVHSGEKPYKCNRCPKAFNSTSNLKNHQRLHADEKAFTCEHCSKSFVDIHHLQRHIRVHTGQRPYICHVCCNAFYCQNGIREHLKTHIPERNSRKAEQVG